MRNWLAVLSMAAAAVAQTCPDPPNQVSGTVTVQVTFDSGAGLYTYSYTIANAAASQQMIDNFGLTVLPPVSNITSPTGWKNGSFGPGTAESLTARWGTFLYEGLPPGEPDTGQVTPPVHGIRPGETLGGFSFKSPNPPATQPFWLTGFAQPGAAAPDEDPEEFMERCPQNVGDFFDLAAIGFIDAPSAPCGGTVAKPPVDVGRFFKGRTRKTIDYPRPLSNAKTDEE